MFKKLRRKFVWGSALVLMLVIVLVVGITFWATLNTVSRQTMAMVNMILDNNGELPERSRLDLRQRAFLALNEGSVQELLFFSARVSDGVTTLISKRFFWLTDEDATALVDAAMGKTQAQGNMTDPSGHLMHYVRRLREDGSSLVVFVDNSGRHGLARLMVFYMAALWGIVLILFVILMNHFSRKLVKPFIENDERQKRFITNASHELKTPLAVISANNEMAEAIGGKTKWTESTSRQVKRLQSLIEELVVLARLDEMKEIALSDVDFSAVVRDTAEPFRSMAEASGRQFECTAEENLHVRGEKRALQQIVSVLMDNAAKYCDEGGRISVRLAGKGKGAVLSVANTYAEGKNEDLSRFFERFYRQDESHHSGRPGFGIGLSMAREMTERMKGKMKVSYSGDSIIFTVELS